MFQVLPVPAEASIWRMPESSHVNTSRGWNDDAKVIW